MVAHLVGAKFAALVLQAQPNPGGLSPEQITQLIQQVQPIAIEALKRPLNPLLGLVGSLVPFAFFAMIILMFWLSSRQRQARIQARADLQKHLLDKFSSGREFADFLESTGGRQFLTELQSQSVGSKERILASMRNGIVLATLGLGMLGLAMARRGFPGFLVLGVLSLALGAGFLISTAISNRFLKQWDENQKMDRQSAPVA